MALAVVISTLPASPASGRQVGVPIFVIGMDDGLSPAVIRRNSEEFREVVFRLLAQALAVVVQAQGPSRPVPLSVSTLPDGTLTNSPK